MFLGSTSRRHRFPKLYASTLSQSRTSLDRKPAQRALSCVQAHESERADEPGLLTPGHPKPYGYIRRCQRDAFLRQRKASCEMPACELHRSERGSGARFCTQHWKSLDAGLDTLRRGDRALPPT
jgi:hypothetical protein